MIRNFLPHLVGIVLVAIFGQRVLVASTVDSPNNVLHSSSNIMSGSVSNISRGGDNAIYNNYSEGSIGLDSSMLSNATATNPEVSINRRRAQQFFDRVTVVSSMLLRREKDAQLEQDSFYEEDNNEITPQSDLSKPGRHIHIVTTAALPWMTGTAVNPLLRAAYLHDRTQEINSGNQNSPESWVTLVIPWLELPEDQKQVYNGRIFESREEQEAYVRDWLKSQANMIHAAENLKIVFYNARYHGGLGSIFAMGDIMDELPRDEIFDVCILEEPEHINWFRAPGQGWTKIYNYVVGIIHTNYDQYATQHYSGLWTAPAIRVMSAAMIRAYCHKVVKLSDVLQPFAPEKEITENVHGVRREFIQTNKTEFEASHNNGTVTNVYFIGKVLWAKGFNVLLELEDYYKRVTGEYFSIDIYGSGPDQDEITRAFRGRPVSVKKSKTKSSSRKSKERKGRFRRVSNWFRRRRRKEPIPKSEVSSMDDLYKDLLTVMEALPSKARESFETIPAKFRKTLEQLIADIAQTKASLESMPLRARESLETLANDFSTFQFLETPLPKSMYEFRRQPIPANFPGRIDHAKLKDSYSIFVNPSLSEVLCTTTAEALSMGKFAIIPVHPSNTFFLKFPNCLGYRNNYEFLANLRWALTHDPEPLTEELAREFTWEAATDRLLSSASITYREAREREILGKSKTDERIAWFHSQISKSDMLRKVLGGGPISGQMKYDELQKRREVRGSEADDEENDEGFSTKFRDSQLVDAIREATKVFVNAALE